jgi:hypothetical protein
MSKKTLGEPFWIVTTLLLVILYTVEVLSADKWRGVALECVGILAEVKGDLAEIVGGEE